MDPGSPYVEAMVVDSARIVATGTAAALRAACPDAVEQTARGVIVPGFVDSHFYLQRGGIKVVDLFPDREPTIDEFQEAMARTALDADWNGADPPTPAERRQGLIRIQPLLHGLGITTVVDPWATAETVRGYHAAHRDGGLSLRVVAMPYFEGLRDAVTTAEEVIDAIGGLGVGSGFGDDTLSFGALKVYVDGEGKRMQALRERPWPATGEHGVRAISDADLDRIALFCARNGWALGVHAIGGRAMRLALESFARVDAVVPLRDLRFRLIHAYLEPDARVLAEAARLGVLVSSQPAIQWHNGAWLRDSVGADEANPLRSWLDAGVRVALGSDGPYFPFDPLRLMWFTRTRAVRGLETPVGIAQRLTPEEALRAATTDAAFAAFTEHDRGMLSPGRLADWAELTVDPLTASDDDLAGATVARTVAGGRIVYDAA